MTAQTTVNDGEIRDLLQGKFDDLGRRIIEGTLPLRPVVKAIQQIVEGDFIIGGLLKFVGLVELKPVKSFVVADNFKVGNIVGGRTLRWLGSNFQEHYGDVVEEDVPARTLYIWELIKRSLDEPVTKLLGAPNDPNTQTHLAHMFQMMELGEKGKGRLDGYANFGYKTSPKDGKLWVPGWNVDGGEFFVGAFSSSSPGGWLDGDRVSGG